MARAEKRLSATEVKNKAAPGMYCDGGGLYLQITPTGTKSWLYRYAFKGKTRDMGLGGYPAVTLADARVERDQHRDVLKIQKLDPIEVRDATVIEAERAIEAHKLAEERRITFADAVEMYMRMPGFGKSKNGRLWNAKHKAQWRSTLDAAVKIIGNMNAVEITRDDVKRVLEPIWKKTPETASRLRSRIEAVLDLDRIADQREGLNPASREALKNWLKPRKTAKGGKFPALDLKDMPTWFAELRKREGMSARALEFAVLCAARSGEVIGARWQEIDFEEKSWKIPAGRMKTNEEHAVPLSETAIELLNALPRMPENELIFFAPRGGMLSNMALSMLMRKMHGKEVKAGRKGWVDPAMEDRPAVPHGTCRSTFRDWCGANAYDRDLAELALSHAVGTAVERSYRRHTYLERRRPMMEAWAATCLGVQSDGVVVPLRAGMA